MSEKEYVNKIKEEYTEKDTRLTKLDELKALDKKVKRFPTIFSYIFGSVSTLVFGTGMCLGMKVIGGTTAWMIVGIVIGVIGLGLTSATYAIYNKLIDSRKKKYSKDILALSDELLSEE